MPPFHVTPRKGEIEIPLVGIDVVDLESSESDSSSSLSTGDGSVVSDVSEPPSEAGDRLFTPSLSTQRHQKVLEVLREENAKSVLDMGRKNAF